MGRKSPILVLASLLTALLLFAACGGDDDDEEVQIAVTFDGTTCDYTGPDTVGAGLNDVAFDNQSETTAFVVLLVIAGRSTTEEVLADLGESGTFEDPDDPFPNYLGFRATTVPFMQLNGGSDRETAQQIDPGAYAILCGPGEETGPGQGTTLTGDYFTGGILLVEESR